eukprot:CAMPEP_0194274236 /NCGR_PEP_ID=MMETSP0169-20130528/7358_1 /TAXON_ID=218684 /ORGANISM="Corethron pennatum, Strain L29A3" /LENGTH=37 /DNA_ID= /DNA_START= /DNA_END= /DNA_ORIENTATION=
MRCGYPRFVYHPYVLALMEWTTGTFVGELSGWEQGDR